MELSVIVCTYNRADSLKLCLSFLENQIVHDDISWEVIVVDNNSTDHTVDVIETSDTDKLNIQYLKETNQGLCFARNRGIKAAKGKIIAYLDDDILAEPDWLNAMLSIFKDTSCDAAGGKILFELPVQEIPSWLDTHMWGYLGYLDLGQYRMELDGIRNYPHGGNMAFRREIFDRIGLFNVRVGRTGNKLIKGSETEFFHRLAPAGAKIMYEPSACVRHVIKHWELTKKHFRSLQFQTGKQRGFQEETIYPKSVAGVPLFIIPEFGKALKTYAGNVLQGNNNFRREMDLWSMYGYVKGRFESYRHRKRADYKNVSSNLTDGMDEN
jgi:glycosyltransferase involved in cell wall biosynthesis